jgi:hypothetical protein
MYGIELWFKNLDPSLKASLTVIIAIIILVAIESAVPLAGCIGSLPLGIIAYATQGILVVNYARERGGYVDADFTRLAIKSALWTILFGTVLRILGAVVATGMTFGVFLTAVPFYIIAALVGSVVPLLVTLLFAYLQARNVLPKLSIGLLIAILGLAAMISCCLMGVVGWLALDSLNLLQ